MINTKVNLGFEIYSKDRKAHKQTWVQRYCPKRERPCWWRPNRGKILKNLSTCARSTAATASSSFSATMTFSFCSASWSMTRLASTALPGQTKSWQLQFKPRQQIYIASCEKYSVKTHKNQQRSPVHCSVRLHIEQWTMTENWRPRTFFSLPAQLNNRLVQREVSMDVGSRLFIIFIT